MKPAFRKWIRDGLLTSALLILAFVAALAADALLHEQALIPLFFVLAVFWVSQLTDGYFFGIFSSLFSVLAVNFAFTYPFFAFDFSVAENAVSAGIILVVSISTCALTQKIRQHEILHSELNQEKMRGNLLRAVSHDLRTPLTSIYGATSTVVDNYAVLSDSDKLQMLKGVREDAQWLIGMVENLLSITKFENENVKITKTSVVVEELVGSVLAKFQRRYPDQQVQVQLPEALIILSVDPILIQQVLVNLLENAVQHAKGMTRLTLQVVLREDQAVFKVLDDGCGIPREQRSKLFTGSPISPQRSPDAMKHNMGIGLSVCATIIKAHGGQIFAEALKPRGMCFGFLLETEEIIHE